MRGTAAGFAFLLLAAACARIERDPPPPYAAPETRAVALEKSREALAAGDVISAWNLAVRAGAPRETFEEIALGAAERGSPVFREMTAALSVRFGSLDPLFLDNVRDVARRRREARRYREAAGVLLDAGLVDEARAVARGLPPREAQSVLDLIAKRESRTEPPGR